MVSSLVRFQSTPALTWHGKYILNEYSARSGYYSAQGYGPSSTHPITPRNSQQWVDAIKNLAASSANSKCIVFGFRHPILNVNSVNLEFYKANTQMSFMTQIDPVEISSDSDYLAWVKSFPSGCLVFTDSSSRGQFLPAPNLGYLKSALTQYSYNPQSIEVLPDGSHLFVWSQKI